MTVQFVRFWPDAAIYWANNDITSDWKHFDHDVWFFYVLAFFILSDFKISRPKC